MKFLSSSPIAVQVFKIVNTWLDTPFKSPCPANDNKPWPQEIENFLDKSLVEMPEIGKSQPKPIDSCAVCSLVKKRELNPIDLILGGSMKIVRETPTSAFVRFKVGSVEPETP